jgi:fructokinase
MFTIVGIGEALFDVFPGGVRRLGGAPVNFAVHAHHVLAGKGRVIAVSRIGRDSLGLEIRQSFAGFGLDISQFQEDATLPTGQAVVTVADGGHPTFDILRDVAWDAIDYDDDLRRLASSCDAVCFGTLAQRSPRSRESIQTFVAAAKQAWRLFDVNLRQDFYDAGLLKRGFSLANAAKLNEDEVAVVARMFDLDPDPESIRRSFALEHLIYTRGERGTVIYDVRGSYEGAAAAFDRTPDADSVGAGDSCSAAVTVGILSGWPLQRVADFANVVGAYVASQPGGTPCLPNRLIVHSGRPDCNAGYRT